jgi:MFS family permease
MSSSRIVALWERLRGLSRNPLILSFYVPALAIAICDGMLIPVLPIFAKELAASYGLVGVVLAAQGVGMLVGDVPAGMLTARLGGKKSMLLGIGLSIASTAVLFWTDSILLAIAWRFVSGFGRALWSVARHAYIAGAVRVEVRGRAISLFGGLMRIGRFLGPAVGGVVASSLGLRSAFLLVGVVGAATVAVVAAVVAPTSASVHGQQSIGAHSAQLWATVREHWSLLTSAGLGQLLAQTIRAGRTAIVPLYAADVIGLDVGAIGYVLSISSGVDMLLFYPAGWIMDHLGRKRAIVPSFALQGLGMALVPLTGGFWGLAAATSLLGFGNGLGSGSMMTLGADLAPSDRRGEFLGVWRFIGDGGSSGGPLIVGAVADLMTLPMAAWVMGGVGLAAAAVFGLLVPETLQRSPSAAPLRESGTAD